MKKLLYIAGVCLMALLNACDNFLTVESPDQLTSNNFWRNLSDAEAGIAAAYSQLYLMTYLGDMWSFPEIKWTVEAYREDIVQLGSDALNYPNWVELSNYTYTNGNAPFSTYWSCYYTGINFANQVIEKVAAIPNESIDAEIREQLINEGHFIRAYYHMQLLLNWQEIVVRDKYITDPAELSKSLSSRKDAWDFIIADLERGTKLPAKRNTDNIGRATCGTAYAYLGFAYLTRAYEEADNKEIYLAKAIKALTQVRGYELVSDFGSMFNGENKNNKESIFEIQFSMSSANGATYRTQCHRWIGVSELGGWDEILPGQVLINEFKKEGEIATTGRYDSRMYATLFFDTDYYNDGNGRVYGKDYKDWFSNKDRVAFRKLMPATAEGLQQNYSAINVPLMRYANVLLMKAEALNEQGHPEQAIPLINEIRRVHGDMPDMTGSTREVVRKQIEHERMIEFPLENYRWYDLRRWGKLSSALQAAGRIGFNESNHAFYPIPLTELNANDALK